jgi:hypothetical protein
VTYFQKDTGNERDVTDIGFIGLRRYDAAKIRPGLGPQGDETVHRSVCGGYSNSIMIRREWNDLGFDFAQEFVEQGPSIA